MSRNVLNQMNSIIEVLKSNIKDEYRYLVIDVKRIIVGQENDEPIIDIVKRAKEHYYDFDNSFLALYEYNDIQYVLLPQQYVGAIKHLGLDIEMDLSVIYGIGMLAIGCGKLPIKAGISSLDIIEHCLGIEPQNGADNVILEFSDICDMFASYIVVRVDNSRFEIMYEEDLFRLIAYISADCNSRFKPSLNETIQKIVLTHGSRSIAPSIVNFYASSLIEYSFLQLYQCIEYLFNLNNSFLISESFDVDVGAVIAIIKSYELKISESENLYKVLKQNASAASVETFYEFLLDSKSEKDDKTRVVANYIYKVRCNIAHLRYDQDVFLKNIDWEKCVEALIAIIHSVYNKLDQKIIDVCSDKKSWTPLKL